MCNPPKAVYIRACILDTLPNPNLSTMNPQYWYLKFRLIWCIPSLYSHASNKEIPFEKKAKQKEETKQSETETTRREDEGRKQKRTEEN